MPSIATAILFLACSVGSSHSADAGHAPARVTPPARAPRGQLRDIQQLMVDLAAHNACDALENRMLMLGRERGAPHDGRIWLRRCAARAEDGHLALDLGVWAWTWVDRSSRSMAATFAVRQYVFLEARTTLHARPQIDYDRRHSYAFLWLRPVRDPEVRASTLGHVDADPEGLWSHIVGGIARVFGSRPDDRARAQVDEEGDRRFEETIDDGFTIFSDLCSGNVEMEMGHIDAPKHPRRPRGRPGPRTRIAVHPNGLDVHGPISGGGADMIVEMDVERGAALGRLVCRREAMALMQAFVRGDGRGLLPDVPAIARARIAAGRRGTLRGGARNDCPLYIATTPLEYETAIVGFTVRPRRDRREALVPQCG